MSPSFGNLQVTHISIWLDFFNTQNNYFFLCWSVLQKCFFIISQNLTKEFGPRAKYALFFVLLWANFIKMENPLLVCLLLSITCNISVATSFVLVSSRIVTKSPLITNDTFVDQCSGVASVSFF